MEGPRFLSGTNRYTATVEDGEPAVEFTASIPLPDGAIIQNSLLLVCYYDSQGASRYGWSTRGEASGAHVLGMLEIVKAGFLEELKRPSS